MGWTDLQTREEYLRAQVNGQAETIRRYREATAELVEALEAYRSAKPQCDCTPGSGCDMADARQRADALIAKHKEPTDGD